MESFPWPPASPGRAMELLFPWEGTAMAVLDHAAAMQPQARFLFPGGCPGRCRSQDGRSMATPCGESTASLFSRSGPVAAATRCPLPAPASAHRPVTRNPEAGQRCTGRFRRPGAGPLHGRRTGSCRIPRRGQRNALPRGCGWWQALWKAGPRARPARA